MRVAFAVGALLFAAAAVIFVVVAPLEPSGTLRPIELCFYSYEVEQELCTSADDWNAWLRWWDLFPLVHIVNPFSVFFFLALQLDGRRVWAALLTAFGVFFLAWLPEVVEELSLGLGGAEALGSKNEWDPPDAILGDPTSHAAGLIVAVVLSLTVRYAHPLPSDRWSWRWIVAFIEAFAVVYVPRLTFILLDLDSAEQREQLFLQRRFARDDWVWWTAIRMGTLVLLYALHVLAADWRRGAWGRTRRAFDRAWFFFIGTNALFHLLTIWLWSRPFYVSLWAALLCAASLLVGAPYV